MFGRKAKKENARLRAELEQRKMRWLGTLDWETLGQIELVDGDGRRWLPVKGDIVGPELVWKWRLADGQ